MIVLYLTCKLEASAKWGGKKKILWNVMIALFMTPVLSCLLPVQPFNPLSKLCSENRCGMCLLSQFSVGCIVYTVAQPTHTITISFFTHMFKNMLKQFLSSEKITKKKHFSSQ